MTQTRLQSLYEALLNILIGFTINFIANMVILPHVGFNISMATNFYIGGLYTLISLVRQYAIRRWFNAKLHTAAAALAQLTSKESK
jgi:hypothetical protein